MTNYRFLSLLAISILILTGLFVSAQEAPSEATIAPPFDNEHIQLFAQFEQEFHGTICPEASPQGAYCLIVTGTTILADYGELNLSRIVVADNFGERDEFGAVVVTSSGSLTDADGDTLEFNLQGGLYSQQGSADYRYFITGGTGKFERARGHGAVIVPPPTSSSTGTEIWMGSLFVPRR
jgi:hypothetical protein